MSRSSDSVARGATWLGSIAALVFGLVRMVEGHTALERLNRGGHRIGRANAPISFVVFHDFSCGHCIRFDHVLTEVMKAYPDSVQILTRHYLPGDGVATRLVGLGSECAAEQGAFADYKAVAYGGSHAASDPEAWVAFASAARIHDMRSFIACVQSERYADRITIDTEDGARLGVRGTPTVFLNGRYVGGDMPFAELDSLIRNELRNSRAGGRSEMRLSVPLSR
jgi:protein-disulfide isomerase